MIIVQLGSRSYPIADAAEIEIGSFLSERAPGRTALVVADDNTASHAEMIATSLRSTGFDCRMATVPAGENSKCLAAAAYLYERLAWLPADRSTVVVAVGGGMVGDLAGFVAATYNRGLPFAIVPTSLLAMVDSSVGGKVGINLPQGKNLIGAFHQPIGVWLNPVFLGSLPDREYRSGLAEVVKYGLGLDAEFFAWLEQHRDDILQRVPETIGHVVHRCCELKAGIVAKDEREESGLRMLLNLGHTFGHAFETVSNYAWTHGEAVAAGLVCACRLAERQTQFAPQETNRVVGLLKHVGLPTQPPDERPIDDWLNAMKRDKKVVGRQIRFVLPIEIGTAQIVENVPDDLVRAVLMR
jgi:3-dehydroquinate synthase